MSDVSGGCADLSQAGVWLKRSKEPKKEEDGGGAGVNVRGKVL